MAHSSSGLEQPAGSPSYQGELEHAEASPASDWHWHLKQDVATLTTLEQRFLNPAEQPNSMFSLIPRYGIHGRGWPRCPDCTLGILWARSFLLLTCMRWSHAIWPSRRKTLLSRRTRRCVHDQEAGKPGILVKAKPNPLEGDSGYLKGMNAGEWWNKISMAQKMVPRIMVQSVPTRRDSVLRLCISNPTDTQVTLSVAVPRPEDLASHELGISILKLERLVPGVPFVPLSTPRRLEDPDPTWNVTLEVMWMGEITGIDSTTL